MNYFQILTTFILTAIMAFALHTLDVNAIKLHDQNDLKNQATTLQAQCQADKLITEETDNALQKQDSATAAAYNSAMRMLNGPSPVPAPNAANINHGTPNSKRLYYTDEAAARLVLKRAAVAQLQTDRLLACQSFVKKVWAEHKQPIDH